MKKILVVLCLGLVVGCGNKSEKVDNENDELQPILNDELQSNSAEIIEEDEANIRTQKSYDEDFKQLEQSRLELNKADENSVKGIKEEMILKSLHEELANLKEELKENQKIIQELKQDIIRMTQIIDKVDYRTCECILEYYDCTSSLDEINSIKKCDTKLSGEEIRTLCEQCEDRARASDNVWIPEGLLNEHKELEKEKIKKITEIKKEIEQRSQNSPGEL